MARRSKSAYNVFSLLLTIAFTLLIGVIVLTVVRGGVFDFRSRATKAENKFKSWEFNGVSTEGWSTSKNNLVGVENGFLKITSGGSTSTILLSHANVATMMGKGAKYLKLRLGIGPGAAPCLSTLDKPCLAIPILGIKATATYTLLDTDIERKLEFTVGVDGVVREYSLAMPEIEQVTMSSLTLTFPDVPSNKELSVDWIQLTGLPLPEPSVTSNCKVELATFEIAKTCTSVELISQATYTCSDGYKGTIGNGTACRSYAQFKQRAEVQCSSRTKCNPRVTIYPLPSVGLDPERSRY